jgi:hypothetical protein
MIGTGVRGRTTHRLFQPQPGLRRAQVLFDIIDAESRRRALSDEESKALQGAMRALGMI